MSRRWKNQPRSKIKKEMSRIATLRINKMSPLEKKRMMQKLVAARGVWKVDARGKKFFHWFIPRTYTKKDAQ